MKINELANIFPMMSPEEFGALVEDIKANGLREPIWLNSNNEIIDGRNRFKACLKLDIRPLTRVYKGADTLSFVISQNLKRRHLTPSQVACVAVKAEDFLIESQKAKERQRLGPKKKSKGQIALKAVTAKERAQLAKDWLLEEAEMRAIELGLGNDDDDGVDDDITQKVVATVPQAKQKTRDILADKFNVASRYVSDANTLKKKQPELFARVEKGDISLKKAVSQARLSQFREKSKHIVLPKDKFRTIVIDPPWPMQKIDRDVRDNQVAMDYPTMTIDEIRALEIEKLAYADCHLYLWVTHKYLPAGLELAKAWGFNYQCVMTWVKNVGFTPFSWMYSTEHVLFCKRGNLPLDKLGMRLDFSAKVREHSRKPEEFYELIKKASPEPRIDIFSRESRKGFQQWGNESGKFADK